jgi:pimeloyl-ACP methyl ester carboxylesterase
MTVVFVHGVPEVAAIWDGLIAALDRDDVGVLSPPGFGAAVPDGFAPTSDGYCDWLVGELERIGEPVDLVGHDWGGIHAMRAATARPHLVRRLVTDIAGTADPDYVWHDLAQGWQTADVGEVIIDAMTSLTVEERTATLADAGMTDTGAGACAVAFGPEMGTCILTLYRSAVQPNLTYWAQEFESLPDRPPALLIAARDDQYTGGPDLVRRVGARWNAQVAEFDGLGHWWMMHDPARGAAALRDFLA